MFSKRLLIFLLPLIFLVISSCSSSEEQEKATIIEETTNKIGQDIVESIKTPIEQAKLAKEIQESHNRRIQEAVDQQ
jgi:hypothetical protein